MTGIKVTGYINLSRQANHGIAKLGSFALGRWFNDNGFVIHINLHTST
jgi:hypothetical protein